MSMNNVLIGRDASQFSTLSDTRSIALSDDVYMLIEALFFMELMIFAVLSN